MSSNENYQQPSVEAISALLGATEESLRDGLIAAGPPRAVAAEMALVTHEAGFRYALGSGLVQKVSPQLTQSRADSPPLDRNWMELRESISVQYHFLNIEETQLDYGPAPDRVVPDIAEEEGTWTGHVGILNAGPFEVLETVGGPASHGWSEIPDVPVSEPVMMIADEEAGVVVYPGRP